MDALVWRYVDSARNPAEDITSGKTLRELAKAYKWSLWRGPAEWPGNPTTKSEKMHLTSGSPPPTVSPLQCLGPKQQRRFSEDVEGTSVSDDAGATGGGKP